MAERPAPTKAEEKETVAEQVQTHKDEQELLKEALEEAERQADDMPTTEASAEDYGVRFGRYLKALASYPMDVSVKVGAFGSIFYVRVQDTQTKKTGEGTYAVEEFMRQLESPLILGPALRRFANHLVGHHSTK